MAKERSNGGKQTKFHTEEGRRTLKMVGDRILERKAKKCGGCESDAGVSVPPCPIESMNIQVAHLVRHDGMKVSAFCDGLARREVVDNA